MSDPLNRIQDLLVSEGFSWDDCLVVAEAGSTMHGVGVGDQDDLDLAVVRVEPWEEFALSGTKKQSVMIRTQPEGVRSGPGDIDIQCYSFRKYVTLVSAGNPTLLNTLWVPSYFKLDPRFPLDHIRRSVDMGRAGAAYLGYMQQQLERWQGLRGQKNVNRPELIEAYGFDTKYAYHAIRLGLQGIEFMTTRQITLPIPEPQRSRLASLRTGGFSEPEALNWAADVEEQLREVVIAQNSESVDIRPLIAGFYRQWFSARWDDR